MNTNTNDGPVIILGSAGRRVYLVDWFREAFVQLGLKGSVVVAENDPTSASYSAGDSTWHMPRYGDSDYENELLKMVKSLNPLAYISLNDYELMRLGKGPAARMRASGVTVPGVSNEWMTIVADKKFMASRLESLGIRTPRTCLASDVARVRDLARRSEKLIVKHRYGSGSSGLKVVASGEVEGAIRDSVASAPVQEKQAPCSAVVVQEYLAGPEYGVDIVASPVNPGLFRGVLARQKLRMRAGETDKAVTVASEPFQEVGQQLASLTSLTGLMDVDFMTNDDGELLVIDINPRFGGGYPFVHLAGADIPLLYLSEILQMDVPRDVLKYERGITSAKYEGIRATGGGAGESSSRAG